MDFHFLSTDEKVAYLRRLARTSPYYTEVYDDSGTFIGVFGDFSKLLERDPVTEDLSVFDVEGCE